MAVQKKTWGGLSTYVVWQGSAAKPPDLAVVLCHGYGAAGTDLVGLVQAFAAVRPKMLGRIAFIFPAAPLSLADLGMAGGAAWWNIDLDRLLNRPTPELYQQFRRNCPDGMCEARDKLTALLSEAAAELGITPQQFVLGGFSQGSMLATDVALRMSKGPAALCILSGALINEVEWGELASKRGPLTILQSHGRQDPILMFPQATALRDLLVDAGHQVEFIAFDGYHEIQPVVIHRMTALLERLLDESSTSETA